MFNFYGRGRARDSTSASIFAIYGAEKRKKGRCGSWCGESEAKKRALIVPRYEGALLFTTAAMIFFFLLACLLACLLLVSFHTRFLGIKTHKKRSVCVCDVQSWKKNYIVTSNWWATAGGDAEVLFARLNNYNNVSWNKFIELFFFFYKKYKIEKKFKSHNPFSEESNCLWKCKQPAVLNTFAIYESQ